MNKWADYLISAVRYETNSNNKLISYFKVHTDDGNSIGESRTWTKNEILDALIKGKSFVTILKGNNDKWLKGDEISISSINKIFIRTDFKNIPEDFLGNLPNF